MKTYTRTLKEIIDYPALSDSDSIFEYDRVLQALNDKLYGGYLDIDYESEIVGFSVETKIDVMYDHRRGATCQVLKYLDVPIAIYMGAGRELDDVQSCYVLEQTHCEYIINLVKRTEEANIIVSNLDDVVPLLYWEGIPVDLGDNGIKS